MSTTVQQLIDDARLRHWSFADVQLPDGAALRRVMEHQRALLLALTDDVGPLIGTTQQIAATVSGGLVGVDSVGTPYYLTTTGTGYAVLLDASSIPYIDLTGAAISFDPFGVDGAERGFPLPSSLLRLLQLTVVMKSGDKLPVELVEERVQLEAVGSRTFRAFISGNRVVPIRQGSAPFSDAWDSVSAVRLAYVACPTLTALSNTLTLPDPCLSALTAGLAELFAGASKHCPESDKRRFEQQRRDADALVSQSAGLMLTDVVSTHVVYRG